jgi:hypothetical protein
MKKAAKFTLLLALWLTLLFIVGMMMTFVTEIIQQSGFFGDIKSPDTYGCMDKDYIWGARHYWYFWLCFILFLISLVRIIIWIDWYWSNSDKSLTK